MIRDKMKPEKLGFDGGIDLSRAFVKEEDVEMTHLKEDRSYRKKLEEWLAIQEKKLDTLLNDPKSEKIDPERRRKWIEDTRADILKTQKELGL